MRDIRESDWKLLRHLHTQALARFCQHILLEIEAINLDRAKSFHQKYFAINEVRQQRNKEMAQIFDNLRHSTAFIRLAAMKPRGILNEN